MKTNGASGCLDWGKCVDAGAKCADVGMSSVIQGASGVDRGTKCADVGAGDGVPGAFSRQYFWGGDKGGKLIKHFQEMFI